MHFLSTKSVSDLPPKKTCVQQISKTGYKGDSEGGGAGAGGNLQEVDQVQKSTREGSARWVGWRWETRGTCSRLSGVGLLNIISPIRVINR